MSTDQPDQGRRVLVGPKEVSAAAVALTRSASRSLALYTRDLAPVLYDQMEFIETVKQFVLGRRYATVRVIVCDPAPVVNRGHRFVEAARTLSSFIHIRRAHEDDLQRRDDFLIADRSGLLYRADASRYDAVMDPAARRLAQRYLAEFDAMWDKSIAEPEFRRLHI